MSRLTPLLESSTDDLERELLRAVRRDAPGSAGLRDTALALGLTASVAKALADGLTHTSALSQAALPSGASVAKVASAAKAASTGVALQTAALTGGVSGAGLGTQATLLLIVKYLGGGAFLSFFALASIEATHRASTRRAPVALVASAPLPTAGLARAVGEQRVTSPAPTLEPEAVLDHAPLHSDPPVLALRARPQSAGRTVLRRQATEARAEGPSAPLVVPETPSVAQARELDSAAQAATPLASSTASSTSLAAEIQILDRARTALASGNALLARRLLDQYAASGPSGTLAQEAALLEVRLLLKQGDRRGAASLARAIIRQNPGSSHAASLQQLAAE